LGKEKPYLGLVLALSLNPDRVTLNLYFVSIHIIYDSNSNLNYGILQHAKQYTGTLHHTIKYATA
jgi:hypothetical protein